MLRGSHRVERGRGECRGIKDLKNWANSSCVQVTSMVVVKMFQRRLSAETKKLKLCFVYTESRNQRDTRIDDSYHQKVQYVFKFLEGESNILETSTDTADAMIDQGTSNAENDDIVRGRQRQKKQGGTPGTI